MKASETVNDYHVVGPIGGPDSEWLVYHPTSLSLFVVEKQRGMVLQLREKGYSIDDISLITGYDLNTCETIIKESDEVFKKKDFEHKNNKKLTKISYPNNIWFFVSTGCNMACRYCYVSGGNFNKFPREIMSEEMAKISVQRLLYLLGDRIEIISFFGGEPLLAFKTIKVIVEEFIKNGLRPKFTIATNGTLLNQDMIDFFIENNFTVTVSVDGPEKVHDYNRIFPNGEGSFKQVMKNVELLKKNNVKLAMQSTYTYYAFKKGYSLINLAEFLSSMSPIVAIKKEEQFPLLEGKIASEPFPVNTDFLNMAENYVDYIFSRLASSTPIFDIAIARAIGEVLNKVHSNFYPCGFKEHLTIYPNGSVYSCHLLTNTDLKVSENILDLDRDYLYNKYDSIEEWLKNNFVYSGLPQKVWFSDFQDLCPASLICPQSDTSSIKKRFLKFTNFQSSFWDRVLKNIYLVSKSGHWDSLLENIKYYFGG
jgi:uncharacterized protein